MQKKYRRASVLRFLAAVLLALMVHSLLLAGISSAEEQGDLSEKWIDLSLGPPLLELFNERARPDDIARVEHISQLDLLRDVKVGKKLVVFKSAEDAIRLLPHIHDEIDIVGYNLEHGPANPIKEQEDPVEYIKQLREAADEYGLEVALGPDRSFALSDASRLAPYADYIILQIQKVQTEPETVYDFVIPVLRGVRLANPDIQTSVQIRTEGNVSDLLEMLEPLQDQIDGISILTSEETIEVSEEIMGELRAEPVEPVPTPTPREESLPEDEGAVAGSEIVSSNNPITATIVASANDDKQVIEQITNDETSETAAQVSEESPEAAKESSINEPLSTPESNQRNGSTWLIIVIALIIGFALGAGYVSYRASS